MILWSAALPLLKRIVPLRRLARLMSGRPAARRQSDAVARVERLATAIYGRRVPLRDNCLERSLLVYHFLSLAGAEPRLTVGVRKGEETLDGHVWVVADGRLVADQHASLQEFTPLVIFGAGGRIE